MNAEIFDIYRGTTHDGPGMRTTIFFKGCPLRCKWCHNPEGISFERAIWWERRKCIGCASCEHVCDTQSCRLGEDGVQIRRDTCRLCGACVRACPGCALTWTSRRATIDELVDTVCRDKPYFAQWGGGVTASGGEALAQAPFVARLFEALRGKGVETALDTCGYADWNAFERVLPHTDYVLYDVKILDDARHRLWTGHGSARILDNLSRLARRMREGDWPGKLWIRTPLIPEATATDENMRAIGQWIARELGDLVERWELCAFNNTCSGKYGRLQTAWYFDAAPLLTQARADALRAIALEGRFPAARCAVTGVLQSD